MADPSLAWLDYNLTTGPEFGRLNQKDDPLRGFSISWPKHSFSAAILCIAFSVLLLTCCGAVVLVIAACCGSRRRDTVAESTQARWVPGVGALDYVPPSERSSLRVSLVINDDSPVYDGVPQSFTLPLMPPDSAYRPFRETLDTPLLEDGGSLVEQIQKKIESNETSMNFERETELFACTDLDGDADSLTTKESEISPTAPFGDENDRSAIFKKCSNVLNKENLKRTKKNDKEIKKLRREIEMIELYLKNNKKPKRNSRLPEKESDINWVSKHGSVDDILVSRKYREDLFKMMWNKQQEEYTSKFASRQTIF